MDEKDLGPDEEQHPVDERDAEPARRALDAIKTGVSAATDAIVEAARSWQERPGARVRRVRRQGLTPLPYLYDVHPEARQARPVSVGTREIEVADIAGTAVGGGDQRGGDFLPLKPFRGQNWAARWQRLRLAHDRLEILPPIEVLRYADAYWVMDGHNRVGLALYAGQGAIDATVTELVPAGAQRVEPIISLAQSAADSLVVRTAGSGHRPSDTLSAEQEVPTTPTLDGTE
jgi:hypothetical protein